MQRNQSGFTLIEIAIVLVIIGLLLGGVLKGQELINSAKVKNLATDFKNIPVFIYGYQDKFKALPGDDANCCTANGHLGTVGTIGSTATCNNGLAAPCTGNGVIDGAWDSITAGDESVVFWQHVRLAGLAAGATTVSVAGGRTDPYFPLNAVGGRIGIEAGGTKPPIAGMKGTYVICSEGILGKFAKQLDVQMDNGDPASGSMMIMDVNVAAVGPTTRTPATAKTNNSAVDDATPYTVCMGI